MILCFEPRLFSINIAVTPHKTINGKDNKSQK